MTVHIKPAEQYILVVLFIILHKMVLTFEFVNESLKVDYSNNSSSTVTAISFALFDFLNLRNFSDMEDHHNCIIMKIEHLRKKA